VRKANFKGGSESGAKSRGAKLQERIEMCVCVCVCVCVKEGEGASGEGVSRGVSFQISQKRSFEFSIVTCNL
jgi:hypothetical protein